MWVTKKTFAGITAILVSMLFVATAVAGEAQKQLTSESVIQTIMKRGKIKVGMATFVPWAMRNKEGELIGFEIDVATKLALSLIHI